MIGSVVQLKAREWIGTPYIHQASKKYVGTDCFGLLCGIWQEIYGTLPEIPPAYSMDWSEADHKEFLWDAAVRHLISKRLDDKHIGDVLLFRMRDNAVAKHLGIQSMLLPQAKFIHAYSGHAVCETAFSSSWANRLVARFAFPEK